MAHEVYNLISEIAIELDVRLTDAARAMLAQPIEEQFPDDAEIKPGNNNREIVASSIRLILSTVKLPSNFHPQDRTPSGALNARAIIRGFWLEFCRIPPFCGR